METKFFGYIAALAGLAGIALSTPKIYSSMSFLSFVPSNYLLIGGVILVGVGVILFSSMSGKSKGKEVPIYKGKEIIGYRVVK